MSQWHHFGVPVRFITWQRNRLLGFSATSFPLSAPREIQKPAKVPWKSLTSGRDSPLSGLFQKRITTPLLREEQYCLKHSPFAHVLTCKSCSLRGSGAVKSSQWDDLFFVPFLKFVQVFPWLSVSIRVGFSPSQTIHPPPRFHRRRMNGSLRPTLYPDRTAVRMDGSDCSARARPKPTSYCLSATLSGLLKTDDNF